MKAMTIVARNYIPQARVLAESFLHHHPDASFVTLILDGIESDREVVRPGEVLLIDEIGLPTEEWQSMAAIYDVMEFATAVKPAVLRHILTTSSNAEAVAYIDPDIAFYAPIDDVFSAAVEHNIVLTPHVLAAIPRDGNTPDEAAIRTAGIFNLGFICVGPTAGPFLDWWHERLRTDAVHSPSEQLFTDQRWIDWVPALFDHFIERNPGLNVAYWNIHERTLSEHPDGFLAVNGQPLRFFHFSGYDPLRPWWLSKHSGPKPRISLLEAPLLQALCADYGARLVKAGWGTFKGEYGFARSHQGVLIDVNIRRALRKENLDSQLTGEGPPNPFAPSGEFLSWLATPAIGPADASIGPWEFELYASSGYLQRTFPNLELDGSRRYRHWLDTEESMLVERKKIGIPNSTTQLPKSAIERRTGGWNVVGYHSAEMGLGEAGRRIQLAIEAAGLPATPVGSSAATARQQRQVRRSVSDELDFRDSIYCSNADSIGLLIEPLEHPDRQRGDARRIGLWFWELTTFPQEMQGAAELLDEVWVASDFYKGAIEEVVSRPVTKVPLPVMPPAGPTAFTRAALRLPDGFMFTFSFDFNSIPARKNPTGVVTAYCEAFGPDDGASLVLKSISGHLHRAELDRLRWSIRHRPDIHLFDQHWSHLEMAALLELTDCFVSLHRSEGFGIHMADAMAAAVPVIATGYGGNLEYMDDSSALVVPYDLVPVGHGSSPYPPTALWAEPDLTVAASHMRALFDDPTRARELGILGQRRVLSTHSLERASAAISEALHPGLTKFSPDTTRTSA